MVQILHKFSFRQRTAIAGVKHAKDIATLQRFTAGRGEQQFRVQVRRSASFKTRCVLPTIQFLLKPRSANSGCELACHFLHRVNRCSSIDYYGKTQNGGTNSKHRHHKKRRRHTLTFSFSWWCRHRSKGPKKKRSSQHKKRIFRHSPPSIMSRDVCDTDECRTFWLTTGDGTAQLRSTVLYVFLFSD